MVRVRKLGIATITFSQILLFAAAGALLHSGGSVHAVTTYNFSGNLTDSNGSAVVSASLSLKDSYGNTVSTTTGAGGAFSLAVEPGMYYISGLSGSGIDGLAGHFSMSQSSTSPSIDLTTGNVTQNLVLPVATVNFSLYNAQGYANANGRLSASLSDTTGSTSLYAGDSGETFTSSGFYINAGSTGIGSFKVLAGTNYGTTTGTGLCSYDYAGTTLYGCIQNPFTTTSGTNSVSVPKTQPAANTFSGTLTDSNGSAMVGVSLSLKDSYGNTVPTTTSAGGAFSLAVEPGMYYISNLSGSSVDGIAPRFVLTQSSTAPSIDLTTGNVTQNLVLPVTTVNYTLFNAQGAVNANGRLSVSTTGTTGVTSLYAGDPGEAFTSYGFYANGDASGLGSFKALTGTTYGMTTGTGLCDYAYPGGTLYGCTQNSFTTASSTNSVMLPKPPAPTGLTASTPTGTPNLSWAAVAGAVSYNIYRDGSKIGSSVSASFLDNAAPAGTRSFYVTALDSAGDESGSSNTISVVVLPSYTGTLSDSNGNPIVGAQLFLKNASGNIFSTITSTGGGFKLAVTPGMYYIYNLSGSNIDGISAGFNMSQSSASPSIDLTTSNVTQNLVLPVATVNYSLYNAQGYVNPNGRLVGALYTPVTGSTSLYASDPGETVSVGSFVISSNSSGTGSFKVPAGITYGTTSSDGLCSYNAPGTVLYACVPSPTPIASGTSTLAVPQPQAPTNTFSGALTDSNGNAVVGSVLSLKDAYGNMVSTTTGTGGVFSLTVEPGMYYISRLSGTAGGTAVDGLASYFTMSQSSTTPSIDLTTGNVTQSLVLPVATVNYTLYNGQSVVPNGILSAGISANTIGSTSLYASDPGEALTVYGFDSHANSSGVGSFKVPAGITYSTISNPMCAYSSGGTTLYGCLQGPFTTVSGVSNVAVPALP